MPVAVAALIWFGTEYLNLLAAFEAAQRAGADRHLCELPRFMRSYFARRCGTTMLNGLFGFRRGVTAPAGAEAEDAAETPAATTAEAATAVVAEPAPAARPERVA